MRSVKETEDELVIKGFFGFDMNDGFEPGSGGTVGLSKEVAWREGRACDAAQKADEFIQTRKRRS